MFLGCGIQADQAGLFYLVFGDEALQATAGFEPGVCLGFDFVGAWVGTGQGGDKIHFSSRFGAPVIDFVRDRDASKEQQEDEVFKKGSFVWPISKRLKPLQGIITDARILEIDLGHFADFRAGIVGKGPQE